jgi:hypothetical protein
LYIPDWWVFVDQVWTALELVLRLGPAMGIDLEASKDGRTVEEEDMG